ncbi:MAG TPA: DNA repair protein RadC [Caulobacteraceae bacterium]|jgi:DNA repair protein RadC
MHDGSLGLFRFDPAETVGPLAPPAETEDEAPAHYHGHRDRLRLRARRAGPASLPDYELLELFLYRSIPRSDVKPLAKALLARFGGLGGVLGASIADLRQVPGVGEAVALDLKLMQEAALRMGRETLARRPLISSWSALLAYVRAELAHEAKEQFRVLFLDKKNQLVADEMLGSGTVDHAPVYPREVARRSLELSASAVILLHNHPSGDPSPSPADIDMTRQIVDALRPLRIAVHDHLVVGRDGVASFKALGLF